MRCLIIQDQLRVGGTERQSLRLAHHFTMLGDAVRLLTFRPGGHLATPANLEGLDVQTLQPFDSHLGFWAPRLTHSIRAFAPDVILCMGRTANCFAGFIQLRFPNIPVVGTLRTGKALFPLHRWSITRVRAVLANSNWWARRLAEANFPKDRVFVVHNALLLEHPDAERPVARQRLRAQLALPADALVLLNVATFRPGKRHRLLIDLFHAFIQAPHARNAQLWLVGDGRTLKRCKRKVRNLNLAHAVRFFDYQHDLFPFYAAADLAVSASQEDSLPNFLIEAQAARLPVVAVDCRGVAETCLHNQTGFIVPPNNPDAFTNALHTLATNPKLRLAFASATRPFVEQFFSPIPQANAIHRFLLSLLQ